MITPERRSILPHIWLPIRSNPSPWPPKKGDVEGAVTGAGATLTGFYSESADPAQAFVLAEVSDKAHGGRVRDALQPHGTAGRAVHLDEI
jgi:hypothetical protein